VYSSQKCKNSKNEFGNSGEKSQCVLHDFTLTYITFIVDRDNNRDFKLHRGVSSLKTVARELGKCKLDLVGAQEVRWEKDYTFLYGKENEDHQLGTGSLYMRESYQQLGG
jgi:hypothetical protein